MNNNNYRVELRVIEAKNLRGGDLCGLTADPYVRIISKQSQQQTEYKQKTKNPHWDQVFYIDLDNGEEITFEIWDYDMCGKNDLIGRTHYKFMGGNLGVVNDLWLSVDCKGELHVQVIIKHVPPMNQSFASCNCMPTKNVSNNCSSNQSNCCCQQQTMQAKVNNCGCMSNSSMKNNCNTSSCCNTGNNHVISSGTCMDHQSKYTNMYSNSNQARTMNQRCDCQPTNNQCCSNQTQQCLNQNVQQGNPFGTKGMNSKGSNQPKDNAQCNCQPRPY